MNSKRCRQPSYCAIVRPLPRRPRPRRYCVITTTQILRGNAQTSRYMQQMPLQLCIRFIGQHSTARCVNLKNKQYRPDGAKRYVSTDGHSVFSGNQGFPSATANDRHYTRDFLSYFMVFQIMTVYCKFFGNKDDLVIPGGLMTTLTGGFDFQHGSSFPISVLQ